MANHHSIETQQTTNTSPHNFLSDAMLPLFHSSSLCQPAHQDEIEKEFTTFKNVCENIHENPVFRSANSIASLLSTAETIYIKAFSRQDSDTIAEIHQSLYFLLTDYLVIDEKKLPVDLYVKLYLFAILATKEDSSTNETYRKYLCDLLTTKLSVNLAKENASQILELGEAIIHLNIALHHPLTSLKRTNDYHPQIENCLMFLENIYFSLINNQTLEIDNEKARVSLTLAKLSSFFLTHKEHLSEGNIGLNKLTYVFKQLLAEKPGLNINSIMADTSLPLQIEKYHIELFYKEDSEISQLQKEYLRITNEFLISFYYSYYELLQPQQPSNLKKVINICGKSYACFLNIDKQFNLESPTKVTSSILMKLYHLQQVRFDIYDNSAAQITTFNTEEIINNKLLAINNMGYMIILLITNNFLPSKQALNDFLHMCYDVIISYNQPKYAEIIYSIQQRRDFAFKLLTTSYSLSGDELQIHLNELIKFVNQQDLTDIVRPIEQTDNERSSTDEENYYTEQLETHYQLANSSNNNEEKLKYYTLVINCYDDMLEQGISPMDDEIDIHVVESLQYTLKALTSEQEPKVDDVDIYHYRNLLVDISSKLMSAKCYQFDNEEISFILQQADYARLSPLNETTAFPEQLIGMFVFADAYLSKVKPEQQQLGVFCGINQALQEYIMSYYQNNDLANDNNFYIKSVAFEYWMINMAIEKQSRPLIAQMICTYYPDITKINIDNHNYQGAYVNMARFFLYYKYILSCAPSNTLNSECDNTNTKNIISVYQACLENIKKLKDENSEEKLYLQKIICHPGWLSLKPHPATVKNLAVVSQCFKEIITHYLSTNDIKAALAYFTLSLDVYDAIMIRQKVKYNQCQPAIKAACKHYLAMTNSLMKNLSTTAENKSLRQLLEQCRTKLIQVLNPTEIKAKKKKRGRKRKGNYNRMQAIHNLNTALKNFLNQTNQAENNQYLRETSAADISSCGEQGTSHQVLFEATAFCLNASEPGNDDQKRAHIIKQKKLLTSYSGPYHDVISKNHQVALADLKNDNPKTQNKQQPFENAPQKKQQCNDRKEPQAKTTSNGEDNHNNSTNKGGNDSSHNNNTNNTKIIIKNTKPKKKSTNNSTKTLKHKKDIASNDKTNHKTNKCNNTSIDKNRQSQLGDTNAEKKQGNDAYSGFPYVGLTNLSEPQNKSKDKGTNAIAPVIDKKTIGPEYKPTYAAIQFQLQLERKNKPSKQTPQRTTAKAKEPVHTTIQDKTEIPSHGKSNPTEQQKKQQSAKKHEQEIQQPTKVLTNSLPHILKPTKARNYLATQHTYQKIPFFNDMIREMGAPQAALTQLIDLYSKDSSIPNPEIQAMQCLFLMVKKTYINLLRAQNPQVKINVKECNRMTFTYLNFIKFTYFLPSNKKKQYQSFDELKIHLLGSSEASCHQFEMIMNMNAVNNPIQNNNINRLPSQPKHRVIVPAHLTFYTPFKDKFVPVVYQLAPTFSGPGYTG